MNMNGAIDAHVHLTAVTTRQQCSTARPFAESPATNLSRNMPPEPYAYEPAQCEVTPNAHGKWYMVNRRRRAKA